MESIFFFTSPMGNKTLVAMCIANTALWLYWIDRIR